jgi:hypothetical protein
VEKEFERLHLQGFLDLGYWLPEGSQEKQPYWWRLNGNARRVLAYRTGLRFQPHSFLSTHLLAEWIEAQGAETWWTVSNEPYLMTELSFPASAPKLAEALRTKKQHLLIALPAGSQLQGKHLSDLGELSSPGIVRSRYESPLLTLSWSDDWRDWRLLEDRGMAEYMKRRDAQFALESARTGGHVR